MVLLGVIGMDFIIVVLMAVPWGCLLTIMKPLWSNYINTGYGLSLVDTLWNASSCRQPLEQEGNPMTWKEKFWLQISLIVAKKS